MKLCNFHRSSASYRVRIALALKGLEADIVTVNLRRGEQRAETFRARAPSGLVPQLEDRGLWIGQSLAIIQYLDDAYPELPLIPRELLARAGAWELALTIACDIHPLNNLRVLNYLEHQIGADEAQRTRWYAHWVDAGLDAFEALLSRRASEGPFCLGTMISIADVCLVPQVANARRFNVPLERFPRLVAVDAHCRGLPAFVAAAVAAPDNPAAEDSSR